MSINKNKIKYILRNNKLIILLENGEKIIYNLEKVLCGYLILAKYYMFKDLKVIRVKDGKKVFDLNEYKDVVVVVEF